MLQPFEMYNPEPASGTEYPLKSTFIRSASMVQPFEMFDVVSNTEFPESSAEFLLQIKEGKFAGTVFSFGAIQFLGEDEDGSGRISFDYQLFKQPESVDMENEDSRKDLEQEISVILHTIIENSLKHEEDRNTDTQ